MPFWKNIQKKIKITTADAWFSKYIRLRDAYHNGYVSCVTCGKAKHWKEMHCGHFVTREKLATRFHEKNSHAQCESCNCFKSGEQAKPALAIDRMYGVGTAQMLIDLGDVRGQKKHTKEDLKYLSDKYRTMAKSEAREKGIEL